jgi:16S rRNA (uracil1498-N3)-methyltransferase
MNIKIRNLFLRSDSLSKIELYYSTPDKFTNEEIIITGEEASHITQVMRHKPGDEIYVTNGEGKIFKSTINLISKGSILCKIIDSVFSENKLSGYTFCITKLKNPDRFEFALEKLVELGITNIIVYNSIRSFLKGNKPERWNKILISAMKQSLRCYLPYITIQESLINIFALEGEKILFEQNSNNNFNDFSPDKGKQYYFIFGPEGGLTSSELELALDSNIFKLNSNRLRSETAIISAGCSLSFKI